MDDDHLPFDELPYVCLWHVCSFLPPESLARFSSTSRTMYDVCSSEELWRNNSLLRWQFCNINQIKEGPQRWQRYFKARRQVEGRMDAGRPTKDYRVKTLRGHGADVVSAVCLDGSSGDLENPTPPIVISLSSDHVVYAWDVTEGKPVWTLEGRQVSSIAGLNATVAIGDSNGHVTIHRTSDWSEVAKLAPPTQDRIVTALEFVSILTKKKTFDCILVCYCMDDGSCEIAVINLESYKPLAVLTANSVCTMLSVKGAWLAAAQEQTASEVYVWDLTDIIDDAPPTATTPPSLSPHVTVHVSNSCGRPLVWIKPGTLITMATGQANQFLPPPIPPGPIPNPGQVHIMQARAPMFPAGFPATLPGSDMEVWDVAKYIDGTKKRPSQVFIVRRMYDSKVVKLSCFPRAVAYSNGFLVTGDDSGCVRVLDISDGKCLQEFSDHKGPITDIYADGYRVLTCSKDFSIRVYSWVKEGGAKPSYKLSSRYQLLGGSIALKTHDGFCRVLCQSGSCVGVAGNLLKLYTFIHQMGDAVK